MTTRPPAAKPPKDPIKPVNFRLAAPLVVWLNAACDVLGLKQGQLVTAALAVYRKQLSPRTLKAIDEVLAVRQKP